MRIALPSAIGATVLTLALALAGCSSPTQPTAGPPADAVAIEEDTAPIVGTAGVPADFPSDIPLPGSVPTYSHRTADGWQVDFFFEDDAEPLERAESLGGSGFEAIGSSDLGDLRQWQWANDRYDVSLNLAEGDGGYYFIYIVTEK